MILIKVAHPYVQSLRVYSGAVLPRPSPGMEKICSENFGDLSC